MATDHTHCPHGPGSIERTNDCPPWCEHHYDSTHDPGPTMRPTVPLDPDYLSHVGEWDPITRTQETATQKHSDAHVSLRFSATQEHDEPSLITIDLRLPMGMDIVSLSPDQARQLIEAINLRLLYLQ